MDIMFFSDSSFIVVVAGFGIAINPPLLSPALFVTKTENGFGEPQIPVIVYVWLAIALTLKFGLLPFWGINISNGEFVH